MARNKEKARSMLDLFISMKEDEQKSLFFHIGGWELTDNSIVPPWLARKETKALSMLTRLISMKEDQKKKPKERRPYLASECRDLADPDKWRQKIMRQIVRKVAEIQNESLVEHRLRDLNDETNKLIREKTHWERRIVELGGDDSPEVFCEDDWFRWNHCGCGDPDANQVLNHH